MTAEVTYTSGGVPTAANLNATESKTVAASNAAPSNAVEGRLWYDTNAAHPLVSFYDGSTWYPLPMGIVPGGLGHITDTGTGYLIGGTEVTINGSELMFSGISDNQYAYNADFIIAGNEAGDLFTVSPQYYDGSSWNDFANDVFVVQINAANMGQRESIRVVWGPPDGSVGFRLRIVRTYGTGTAQINGPTDVTVEHIGSSLV